MNEKDGRKHSWGSGGETEDVDGRTLSMVHTTTISFCILIPCDLMAFCFFLSVLRCLSGYHSTRLFALLSLAGSLFPYQSPLLSYFLNIVHAVYLFYRYLSDGVIWLIFMKKRLSERAFLWMPMFSGINFSYRLPKGVAFRHFISVLLHVSFQHDMTSHVHDPKLTLCSSLGFAGAGGREHGVSLFPPV